VLAAADVARQLGADKYETAHVLFGLVRTADPVTLTVTVDHPKLAVWVISAASPVVSVADSTLPWRYSAGGGHASLPFPVQAPRLADPAASPARWQCRGPLRRLSRRLTDSDIDEKVVETH
jgi:hypothetical protein